MSFPREFYKTKLCNLYQRGHCPRQNCSFAHGDAELRRFSGGAGGAFNGRRDFRGGDLRERLDQRPSPRSKRFSPGRDSRGRRGQLDRGRSHSRSPARGRSSRSASPFKSGPHKSYHNDKKRQRLDGPDAHLSDISAELGDVNTWVDESPGKAVKSYCPDPKDALDVELREVNADIDSLTYRVFEVESSLEKKALEIKDLSDKNVELDSQLHKEHEVYKRLGSKMKKFVKMYLRCSRAQEEVKKTQARMQKLVEDIRFGDVTKTSLHGEDSDVNIVSDGEPGPPLNTTIKTESLQLIKGTAKEKNDMDGFALEKNEPKVSSPSRGKLMIQKSSMSNLMETGISNKDTDADGGSWANASSMRFTTNGNAERIGSSHFEYLSNRARSWDMGVSLPSTGLAAHAEDDLAENGEGKQGSAGIKFEEDAKPRIFQSLPEKSEFSGSKKSVGGLSSISMIASHQYAQYEGDDEEVDVEVVDDSLDNSSGINHNAKQTEKGKTSLFPIT